MSGWYDLSFSSNILKQSYINGFIDVSDNIIGRQNVNINNLKDSNTRIGIGTNTSSSVVDVNSYESSILFENTSIVSATRDAYILGNIYFGSLTSNGSYEISSRIRCENINNDWDDHGSLIMSTGVGNTDTMCITSDGNVGIGTINPEEKLDVYGRIHCDGIKIIGGNSDSEVIVSNSTLIIDNTGGDIIIGSNTKFNGNVGVNIATPGYTLHVNGDQRITGNLVVTDLVLNANNSNDYIYFGPGQSSTDYCIWRQIGGNNSIKLALDFYDDSNDAEFDILFNGVNKFSVNSATTVFSKHVEIDGGLLVDGDNPDNEHPTGLYHIIWAYWGGGSAGQNHHTRDRGTLWVQKDIIWERAYATSDKRIKKNINLLLGNESLNLINQLKPCHYEMIETGSQDTGFIAQDVLDVIPLAVSEHRRSIPNIMLNACVFGENKDILYLKDPLPFDLLEKDNSGNIITSLKLVSAFNDEIETNIVEIIDSKQIKISNNLLEHLLYGNNEKRVENINQETIYVNNEPLIDPYTGKYMNNRDVIYVYGQFVDNFYKLKYNSIWSLGISAIKELDKQQQQLTERLEELNTKHQQQQNILDRQEKELEELLELLSNIQLS